MGVIKTYLLLLIVITLTSCETEKDFLRETEVGKKMAREISFEQFKQEIETPNFNTKITLSGLITERGIEDFEVDTTKVKSLEKDYIVYSLKLNPKFQIADNKFYNLLVYKDEMNNLVKDIIEFIPNSEFTGVNEEDFFNYLNTSSKEIIYSSKWTNISNICIEVVWELTCTCEGRHTFGDPNCTCNHFSQSSHFDFVVCPTAVGGNGTTPDYGDDTIYSGGENGTISAEPVLPTKNIDNCGDLKVKSYDQNFKDKMNELKNNSIGTLEKGFQTFSGNPKYSEKYSATIEDQSGVTMPANTRNDYTGFMHCHLSYTLLPEAGNFAIFTPDDFIRLIMDLNIPDLQVDKLSIFMTCFNSGNYYTYSIKIKNMNEFIAMCTKLVEESDYFKGTWQNQIKPSNNPEKQVNEFLKIMKQNGFNDAIELYKCDDNYQNWEQLTLDANNNTIKIKC